MPSRLLQASRLYAGNAYPKVLFNGEPLGSPHLVDLWLGKRVQPVQLLPTKTLVIGPLYRGLSEPPLHRATLRTHDGSTIDAIFGDGPAMHRDSWTAQNLPTNCGIASTPTHFFTYLLEHIATAVERGLLSIDETERPYDRLSKVIRLATGSPYQGERSVAWYRAEQIAGDLLGKMNTLHRKGGW